jgi:hypothetical protein
MWGQKRAEEGREQRRNCSARDEKWANSTNYPGGPKTNARGNKGGFLWRVRERDRC